MRYTNIHLPGLYSAGIMRHGTLSVQDMCDLLRATATRRKGEDDDQILRAADEDFCVEQFDNKKRQRNIKVLQRGRVGW